MSHQFPKLHNAMWPGLVGKGPDSEPAIDLDTMLDLTAKAEVNGVKFDGVDIFLFEPHISIDISDDDLKRVADKIASKGFVVGSVVAPVWPPTGGGSAMGDEEDRKKFVQQVLKGCRIASKLRQLGVRPYGIVRIDSATSVEEWSKDPENSTKRIAQTFREAADVAESFGERLAAEGEICWGGMHSWREMVKLLEYTDRPKTVGFQADMAHTLLYTLGYNAEPEDRIVPESFNWDPDVLDESIRRLTEALRPWTIDFHVAQNDATVHGTGSHDKTGRHCQVNDPNGKLNIAYHAGYWLRDENGELTKATRHICWDGCMFPNEVMMKQQTWNNILATMIAVRDGHGWSDGRPARAGKPTGKPTPSITTKAARPAKVKTAKAKVKTAKVKAKAKVKIKRGAGKKPAKRPVKAKVKSKPAAAKKSAKVKSRKPARKAAAKKPAKKKTGRRK
jgi:sugar phosphate isomerase/epimerase